jgi:hypothetical protein
MEVRAVLYEADVDSAAARTFDAAAVISAQRTANKHCALHRTKSLANPARATPPCRNTDHGYPRSRQQLQKSAQFPFSWQVVG